MDKTAFFKASAGVCACFLLYLLCSFSSWQEPVMGDEAILFMGSKAVFDPGITRFFVEQGDAAFGAWHPPAYVLIIAGLGKWFGFNALTPRLLSIFCFFFSLILIYLTAAQLCRGQKERLKTGLLACLLFAVNPLAVRGSLLVDMDGTILNLVVLFFIWALSREKRTAPPLGATLFYGLLFAAVFCVKLSAPLLLIGALVLFKFWQKDRAGLARTLLIAFTGAVFFALLWSLWAGYNGRSAADILTVPLSVLQSFLTRNRSSAGLSLLLRNAWAFIVWTSVPFIVLAGISVKHVFTAEEGGQRFFGRRQLAVYALIIVLVYLLVGGVTHSFPKYHFAAVAPLSVLIAMLLSERLKLRRADLGFLVICAAAFFLYHTLLIGDPLYGINYLLKQDAIIDNGRHSRAIIIREALRFGGLLLTPVLAMVLARVRKGMDWIAVLAAALCAAQLSLSFVQSRAPYHTVYCYGAQGVNETAQFIRSRIDTARPIIAPQEIRWLASDTLESYAVFKHVRGAGDLLRVIAEKKIACICYGITGNSLAQYRAFFQSPEMVAFLENGFLRTDIGSYTVWLKK